MKINKSSVSFTFSEVRKLICLAQEASIVDSYSDSAESALQAILKLDGLLPVAS